MSTEVCPYCGKAFKRLKSHLPHCKARSRPETFPNITRHQTSQQLSADASKSVTNVKKSEQLAQIPSHSDDASLTREHPLISTAPSTKSKTWEKEKQRHQILSGSNLEASTPVSGTAGHKAEGPELTLTKSKTKKKSLRSLIEAAKSGHVTEASTSADLVMGSALQTGPVAKQLPHSRSKILSDQVLSVEGIQHELLDTEVKPARSSKSKSLSKSGLLSKGSEDVSQEARNLIEDHNHPVNLGGKSSKKSKKVVQDSVLFSTQDDLQLSDAKSKSRIKQNNDSTKIESQQEAGPLVSTTSLDKMSVIAGAGNLPETTHKLGNVYIKPKGKKTTPAGTSNANHIPRLSKDSISASALESGAKDLQHPLHLNSNVKPGETFRKSNRSHLTDVSKPNHVSETSRTQDLDVDSVLEPDPLVSLKTSHLKTETDPPQRFEMNRSPAQPRRAEKSSEASTDISPLSRITIQSLKSTLDRGKPSRSILQDISLASLTAQTKGGLPDPTTGIPVPPPAQFQSPPHLPDAVLPALRRVPARNLDPFVQIGNQSTATEATRGRLEQPLAQVRLRELPNWLIYNTPIHPRAVVGVMQRGWCWYYRKYINVKKGSVGGVSMLLAGYCVLSYIWSYPHLKRERWRKYH